MRNVNEFYHFWFDLRFDISTRYPSPRDKRYTLDHRSIQFEKQLENPTIESKSIYTLILESASFVISWIFRQQMAAQDYLEYISKANTNISDRITNLNFEA